MADLDWSECPAVGSIPGKRSGARVFRITRTPVSAVFDNLKVGASIPEIMDWFHLSPEQVVATDSVAPYGGSAVDRPNVAQNITNFKPQPAGSAGNPASLGTVIVNGQTVSAYANSLGLTQPLLGNYGTLGRNILRINGQTNFDWNVYKNFRVREKLNLQVRGEFYNALNMVAFGGFASTTITSRNFGVYNSLSQNPRLVQLAARFIF